MKYDYEVYQGYNPIGGVVYNTLKPIGGVDGAFNVDVNLHWFILLDNLLRRT